MQTKIKAATTYHLVSALVVVTWSILVISCSAPLPEGSHSSTNQPINDLDRFRIQSVGKNPQNNPWVAHLKAVDLDQDGRMDIVACEAKDNVVVWLRQKRGGSFEETVIADGLQAPVHIEEADLDSDGDLDLVVSCMGYVFPNNDKIGSIIALENQDNGTFRKRTLIEGVDRVTDARPVDLNGDVHLDLAVGQFGYDQGEVQWLEGKGNWQFESHSLLKLSGTINVCVADFNADGLNDIAAQLSQQWEEIHLFENNGQGGFDSRILWGSTNEDFASSGMRVVDLNEDGKPDLLFSNGDGFGPAALPGPRPWHGVQWLENLGESQFLYHRIGYLPGAYGAIDFDLDEDGDKDIVAVSSFNIWSNDDAESLVWFENLGELKFTKHVLAHEPIQLLAVDIADLGLGSGPSLITGGFHAYPPFERMSRISIWNPNK